MVLRHFNLREQPFGVTPDPRFIYTSATHREALSSILYGIQAGLGFITLTGSPGTGKTTIVFEAMRRLKDTNTIAFLFQTISTPSDLLRALLIELGIKNAQGSLAEMQAQLNEVLVAQFSTGKRLVVLIDEAQNLDFSVLEAVRMLSNFETASHKLMQIILAGQAELAEKLALPRLLQFRQRISIFGNLRPLTKEETNSYIQHRLQIAGYASDEPLFTESALSLIAEYSGGMPRNINNICFNALSVGYALQRRRIDSGVIREVIVDLGMKSMSVPVKVGDAVGNESPRSVDSVPQITPKRWALRSIPEIAVCCAVLLGLLLLPHGTGNSFTARLPLPKSSPPLSSPRLSSLDALQRGTRAVEVERGQTLSEICAQNFGECRSAMLREIVRINPSILDPDHIEAGQRLYLPFPDKVRSKTAQASNEQLALYAPRDGDQ